MRSDWLLRAMMLMLSALVATYGRHDNRRMTSSNLNGRKCLMIYLVTSNKLNRYTHAALFLFRKITTDNYSNVGAILPQT